MNGSFVNLPKLKRNLLFFVSSLVFVFIVSSLFSKENWLEITNLNKKKKTIKREILFLNNENRLLKEKIKRIRYDPLYIEKIAREELGMVKSGEIVYKFAASE